MLSTLIFNLLPCSGAISMGLGGYLAAKSEIEHYKTERLREEREVEECPQDEEEEIVEILEPYGLDRQTLQPLIEKLKSDPVKFVDFMMRFELNLEMPDPNRSWVNLMRLLCLQKKRTKTYTHMRDL